MTTTRFSRNTLPSPRTTRARRGCPSISPAISTAAFNGAAKKFAADYTNDHVYQATMEPMNTTAWVKKDEVDVWTPTQTTERRCLRRRGNHQAAAREDQRAHHFPRRRIRPPAGGGLGRGRDGPVEDHRQAGQGRVEPRGRRPARLLPPGGRAAAGGRGRRGRQDRRLAPSHRLALYPGSRQPARLSRR